jgi:prephenate dehydrogenase
MACLPDQVQPLGGHPLCGREVSGIEAAEPTLYRDRTFVLTPLARTSENALKLGVELVGAIGSVPLILDAGRHDRLLSVVSHLPYVVACALVGAAETGAANDPSVWEVAASGFRDTSRVASSDVTMMVDILLTNREAVLEALAAYRDELEELDRLLRLADEAGLTTALAGIRERRNVVYSQPG